MLVSACNLAPIAVNIVNFFLVPIKDDSGDLRNSTAAKSTSGIPFFFPHAMRDIDSESVEFKILTKI
jgi:hypothetical protein